MGTITSRLQQVISHPQIQANPRTPIDILVEYSTVPVNYRQALERVGASRVARIRGTNVVSARATARNIANIKNLPNVVQVEWSEQITARFFDVAPFGTNPEAFVTLAESGRHIGAEFAHQQGITGAEAKIAVIDSGVNNTHPMVSGKVIKNIQIEAGSINDGLGHGTHVATTAAGRRVKSPLGEIVGIAPDASIINVKALNDDGGGSLTSIIQGVVKAVEAGADVINLSVGRNYDCGGTCPLCKTIDSYKERAFFAIAAGNSGPLNRTLSCPSVARSAISVGSSTTKPAPDGVSFFSSRGPAEPGNVPVIKPDCCAPGGGGTSSGVKEYIYAGISGKLDGNVDNKKNGYEPLRGTSMATPHVAGWLALLLSSGAPRINTVEGILQETALDITETGKDEHSGWGRIQVPQSLLYRPVLKKPQEAKR